MEPYAVVGLAATFVAAAATSACLNFSPFGCEEDSQCDTDALGRCEPVGYCSYPDLQCPDTGYRFEDNAGDGLGGDCVGPEVASTGTETSAEGSNTEPVLDTGDTTLDPTTTGPGPDTETDDEGTTTGGDCGGAGQECCPANSCDAGLACTEGECSCITAVTVGDRHTCATKLDGSLWCWGANDVGQIAQAAPAMSPMPLQVATFGPGMVAELVAARNHTCAIRNGVAACWGDNADQKVDFSLMAAPFVTSPLEALWATPATRVGVGGRHTCVARGAALPVSCWGDNDSSQLSGVGEPEPQNATLPMGVEPSAIALGQAHSCVAGLVMGELYCWGANGSGQLGLDPVATPSTNVPTVIPILPIGSVVAGFNHTCARAGADIVCWGRNDQGQVGNGTGVDTSIPTTVAFPPEAGNLVTVVAADDHTCAITATGALYCWGGNASGELLLPQDMMGNDGFALSPRAIELDFEVAQLSTGVTHTCALTTTGQLLCWGQNGNGQIGDGTMTNANEPTPVSLSCP